MPVYIHAHTMRAHTLTIRYSPIYAYCIVSIYITTEIVVSLLEMFSLVFAFINANRIQVIIGFHKNVFILFILPSCFIGYSYIHLFTKLMQFSLCVFIHPTHCKVEADSFVCDFHKSLPQKGYVFFTTHKPPDTKHL